MDTACERKSVSLDEVSRLRRHVTELERQLDASKKSLRDAELLLESRSETSVAFSGVACNLSPAEIARYSRQLLVPGFGAQTQEVMKDLSVLVVGAGGLGCPTALYLAAAGVGTMPVIVNL
jgi:hypothetical protein